ncbi:capZ-interacting protein [Austrofundulus limnaeus]|uniref:CapZ-interacting protein n=1 Tax=Austrofundulus limnaeus TaxID=52670 RepID=A0A2I4BKF3_AUSLI|nr:PREDICTED: capZ-interacting protein-like [Austrofundulus limnaeus]
MEDSPSKPSVAELAGRLKGHILPLPGSNDEFRRRPPCSLKLHNPAENEESDKSVSPSINKTKMKNSAMIEKLQANLALSPSTLLPSPKGPDVKLQPTQLSPIVPSSPLSPSQRPPPLSSKEEDPVGFDSPPEGTPLPSFNKNRPRLSFKRRPPTRQHRRSAGEEEGAARSEQSPSEPDVPKENGDEDRVLNDLKEEADSGPKEAENGDEDCEAMEAEAAQSGGDVERDADRDSPAETLKEDRGPAESAGQTEDRDEADLVEGDTM